MDPSKIRTVLTILTALTGLTSCHAFTVIIPSSINSRTVATTAARTATTTALKSLTSSSSTALSATGNLHGEGSCFLPLLQNDETYIAPRIVQVRLIRDGGMQDVDMLRTLFVVIAWFAGLHCTLLAFLAFLPALIYLVCVRDH